MTRAQHMQWAKDRALALIAQGDIQGAYASMASDLTKHPETQDHTAIALGMMLLMGGHLRTAAQMRDFVNGVQ